MSRSETNPIDQLKEAEELTLMLEILTDHIERDTSSLTALPMGGIKTSLRNICILIRNARQKIQNSQSTDNNGQQPANDNSVSESIDDNLSVFDSSASISKRIRSIPKPGTSSSKASS